MQLLFVAANGIEVSVDFNSFLGVDLVDEGFVFAAANGMEPGNQFLYFKRFHDEVVCPAVQGPDAVIQFSFGRYKDNAALKTVFVSQQSANFYAVHFRQHPVENDDVVTSFPIVLYQHNGFGAVLGPVYGTFFIR